MKNKLLLFLAIFCGLLAFKAFSAPPPKAELKKLETEIKKALSLEAQAGKLSDKAKAAKDLKQKDFLLQSAAINSWQAENLRLKVIKQVISGYRLSLPELKGEIGVTGLSGVFALSFPDSQIRIGKAAFSSPAVLAATLLHAGINLRQFAGHPWLNDSQQAILDEIEALEAAISASEDFELESADLKRLVEAKRWLVKKLSSKNRRKVKNYDYLVLTRPDEIESLSLADALESGYLTAEFQETGKPAGDILKINLKNRLARTLKITLAFGTAFFPPQAEEEVRSLLFASELEIAGGEQKEITVKGISLEPRKPTPPGGRETSDYRVLNLREIAARPDDVINRELISQMGKQALEHWLNLLKLAEVGAQMAKAQQFKNYPGKDRPLAVIQQAVWLKAAGLPATFENIKPGIQKELKQKGVELAESEVDLMARDFQREIKMLLEKAAKPEGEGEENGGN